MPVRADGSTTKMPAHRGEATPCVAEMADNRRDPEVCEVSELNSPGRTTLMVFLNPISVSMLMGVPCDVRALLVLD